MSGNPYLIALDTLTLWELAVRRQSDVSFRTLPEMVLSLPIPLAQESKSLGYFVYQTSIHADLNAQINFPHMLLSVDYPSLSQVKSFQVPTDWETLAEVFPVIRPAQSGDPQMERVLRHQFSDLYEAIVKLFPQGDPSLISTRFLELFFHFTPAVLQTIYERLNPAFWQWLRATSSKSHEHKIHL